MSDAPRPPSPREQIRFLQQLQRLLDEGGFVATYKYALLHAIADLCVVHGDDTGAPLTLGTDAIAERFIELYWRQAMPFPAPAEPAVLAQNTGRQASVVRRVEEAREAYDSLTRARSDGDAWARLHRKVEDTVRQMPLWRLQTIGQETVEFLYPNLGRGREITLHPGVAFCFRRFYPMIADMVEGAWSQYIRRYNQEPLGNNVELRSFLFGSERASLARFGPILRDLQEDACFYCRGRLPETFHVDHFVPWRRYPVDLGHNFVLAHRSCNSSKGDRLAAEEHLERWVARNDRHADTLAERFHEADVPSDAAATRSVAAWAYAQVEQAGGTVWVAGRDVRPISASWREVLA